MATAMTTPVAPAMAIVIVIVSAPVIPFRRARRGRGALGRLAALDDLVELAAVEPHAPAFRAVVDLDALALAHDEIDPAGGAEEPCPLVVVSHMSNPPIPGGTQRPVAGRRRTIYGKIATVPFR